jgi:hypothetical protein
VTWFGALVCAVSMLGLYAVPAHAVSQGWASAYPLTLLTGAAFGIGLAGFVPRRPGHRFDHRLRLRPG